MNHPQKRSNQKSYKNRHLEQCRLKQYQPRNTKAAMTLKEERNYKKKSLIKSHRKLQLKQPQRKKAKEGSSTDSSEEDKTPKVKQYQPKNKKAAMTLEEKRNHKKNVAPKTPVKTTPAKKQESSDDFSPEGDEQPKKVVQKVAPKPATKTTPAVKRKADCSCPNSNE
ncbi:hypothetical protein JTB14_029621 [Gonioctena quinquepunctata]|nr:hypothetical protein JTB14_029621 [Gonioctena quinquepunctata]